MNFDKVLADDPGEMHRGFRLRCKVTDKLKDRLVLFAADAVPMTDEAKAVTGQAVDRVHRQGWSASGDEARSDWFEQTKATIDYMYLLAGKR